MNKQTKQLIVLGGLVVVAAIVAFFMYGGGDSPSPKPTANTAQGDAPPPAPTQGGQAPAGGAPGAPGAAPGAPAADAAADLPVPPVPEKPVGVLAWTWKWAAPEGGKEYKPPVGQMPLYDPLKVQNVDVVDPERRKVIDQLRLEWVLDGIIITKQEVQEKDEAGNMVRKMKLVPEAWFKGKRRPYKENDRLTNTRFTIRQIFRDKERQGIRLISDTGAEVEMVLAPAGRYKDD